MLVLTGFVDRLKTNAFSSNGTSLNISLIYKGLVNFLKLSIKMKWLDFVVGVNFGPIFSSNNCNLDNVYDDKLMIFSEKNFFCKTDDGSVWSFLTGYY